MAKSWHLLALSLYAAESWLFLDHGASLTRSILGTGPDPTLIIWCLAWWPWAFAHHVHSLHTYLLWQPVGLNLAWTTCVPLLSLLALPITLGAGPILAFNLLTLAAPALGAYAAFLLCLDRVANRFAAFLGGFLFGFSPFEAAQSLDHLNLDFTAFLPLILLVVLRRAAGQSARLPAVLWLGLLLAGEFYVSDELLATACLFGALAWALGLAMLPARRPALRALAGDALLAVPLVLALISPLLWPMLTGGFDVAHPANWPFIFSTDALNFLLPAVSTAFGGTAAFGAARYFSGGLDEQAGYLGPVVILLLLAAALTLWRVREFRLAFAMLGIVLLASLGPELHLAGHLTGLALPWALLLHLPLFNAALPARCMVYATLLIALILAGFVAQHPRRLRLLAVLLACLSWLPAAHPVCASPALAFFQPGRLQAALGPDPRVLILPFSISGASSYWQAENGFGFTQAGGYLGYPPVSMQQYPAVMELFKTTLRPDFGAAFTDFCHRTGVQYVIMTPATSLGLRSALAVLDWPARKIDDVTVLTVPPA